MLKIIFVATKEKPKDRVPSLIDVLPSFAGEE
jgi:hypothetical protein